MVRRSGAPLVSFSVAAFSAAALVGACGKDSTSADASDASVADTQVVDEAAASDSATSDSAAGDANIASDASLDTSLADAADAPVSDGASPEACVDAAVSVCVVSAVFLQSNCSDAAAFQTACAKGCDGGVCYTTCDSPAVVIDQSVADDFVIIPPWQTFTVATTGILESLEMRPNVYSANGDPTTGMLSIYIGDGVGGTRIHQQAYSIASASGAPVQTFALTTPVPLQAGQVYTWELTGAKGIYYASTDVYAGGHASTPTRDMFFRAHVAACHL